MTLLLLILLSASHLHAGNTTLTWDPPTTNTDETPLTDLAGYKIHYGTESGNYTETIDIGNVSEYQVNNLTNGATYYFVITAYDRSVPANESGNSNEYLETISSNNQPLANAGGPYSGIEGQSITLDGSGSDDSDGSIDLYEWDINNDGSYDYSSTSATQNHTYAQQGTYTIKLRVTDNLGVTHSTTTTADIADTSPTAGFTGSPTDAISPLQVIFANNSTGYDQPLTYEWDFDNDGATDSTAQNPSYTYPDEGTYSVKLTITDSDGSTNTITRSNYIHVTSPSGPPSARPGGPYSGIEGQSITLDGSGSEDSGGSIALYEWDINNDGTYDYSSTSSTQNHIYAQQGTYTIKLRVTDNSGETDDKTTTADISDSIPVASFTGSPRNGIAPLQLSFVNSSAGHDDPLTYEWDFDNDGNTDSTAPNPSYSYFNEGTYTVKLTVTDSDGSTKTKTRNNYVNVTPSTEGENILGCYDGGNIECLERTDGGNENDNLDTGKPRLDNMEYNFKITVGDASGSAPQYIKLFMTQRSNPSSDDFYGYVMGCSGDYSTGATCSYETKLGPAAVHKFFFEARMSDGTTLRYPDAGHITGPDIKLLEGYNLVGLPRDTIHENLDGISAFGSTSTYRWDADLEYYTKVTIADPVKPGEGYYVDKGSDTLPVHEEFRDLPDAEFMYALKPGWNIISNPYSANVKLSEITIGKGNNTPVAWTEATSNLWMTNAIYFNNGKDWGATYSFETDTEGMLVPWVGYWIYLNMEDDTYYIVIPQP